MKDLRCPECSVRLSKEELVKAIEEIASELDSAQLISATNSQLYNARCKLADLAEDIETPDTYPKLFDLLSEKTFEWCPHCQDEVEIPVDKLTPCPTCGIKIRPCSACPTDTGDADTLCTWTRVKGCDPFPN